MSTYDADPLSRSLEEIEDDRWGPPPEGSTRVVASVHRLRQLPVGALDVEGLRELLLQHEGVETLLPLALRRLREDPLAEGDLYPGDLLAAVLLLRDDVWRRHPEELTAVLALLPTLDRDDPDYPSATDLDEKVAGFQDRHADA